MSNNQKNSSLHHSNTKALGRHLLLSGVAPSTIGIMVIMLATNYVKLAPWDVVLITIGSVLLGVGVFEVVFRLAAFQHFIDDVSSTVLKAMKLPIRVFYESRNHLDSVETELSGVEEMWAVWHVGPYRDFEAFFPDGRRGRILLTHPASTALTELGKIRKRDVECMAGVIRNITRHAIEKNLEVRWFDGPVCNNVIIADPQKDGAWLRVELVVPHQCPQKRPSFVVEKHSTKELFETFALSFEKMWNASYEPDLSLSPEVEPELAGVR